jgi:DNA-binding CsgD family transcriptional regulator
MKPTPSRTRPNSTRARPPRPAARDIGAVQAMLENAERLANLGSWELRPDDGTLLWSDNLFRIYGYEPGVVEPSVERVLELVHPDDRARVSREVDLIMRARRRRSPFEYRVVLPGSGVRHLRASTALIDGRAGSRRIVGAVEDRSATYNSDREIAARVAVGRVLSEWESVELSGTRLLREFGEAMKFAIGVLWVPDGDALAARRSWYSPAPSSNDLRAEIERTRLPRGVGLSGLAWERRTPVTVKELGRDVAHVLQKTAERDHLHGGIAFPATYRDEVLAVFGFAGYEQIALTERLTDCLVSVGAEIGRFLSRRRGELNPALLSTRETEVLKLAADGHSGPDIARALQISLSTVKTHFEHIYAKLHVTDRGNAVAAGLRSGFID